MLTQARLKQLLHYNSETGIFTRLQDNLRWKKGTIAGGLTDKGYIQIRINAVRYKAHQLAFLYMTGNIPERIDHIDTIKSNNSWRNLRIATRSENGCNRSWQVNSTTQIKGLVYYPNKTSYGNPRYKAQVRIHGKCYSKSISLTKNKKEQLVIRELTNWLQQTRNNLHKEFANHV